jgi:hypothetical protein
VTGTKVVKTWKPPHLAKQPGISLQSFLPCSQQFGGFAQYPSCIDIPVIAMAGRAN